MADIIKYSKKGLPTYTENPSLTKMRTEQKPKVLTRGNKAWVAEDTGECYDRAGLYEIVEVDNTPFVKLYVQSIRTFAGLSKTGGRILEIVVHELKKDEDKIFLHPQIAEKYDISERVFFKGVKELCVQEVLFESTIPGWYFINVTFIFNGDRMVVTKEYRRRRTPKLDDPNQLKLFDNKQTDV